MPCSERFKAEDCLKFDQVLSSGLWAVAVLSPMLDRNLDLPGHQMKQGSKRQLIYAEHNAGIAKVAELHSKAEPVSRATTLPNNGQIGLTQGVTPDQVVSVVRQREQALPLGGGKDGTTGHVAPLENGRLREGARFGCKFAVRRSPPECPPCAARASVGRLDQPMRGSERDYASYRALLSVF